MVFTEGRRDYGTTVSSAAELLMKKEGGDIKAEPAPEPPPLSRLHLLRENLGAVGMKRGSKRDECFRGRGTAGGWWGGGSKKNKKWLKTCQ